MLREFNRLLGQGLSEILNISLSEDQWRQAALPVKAGGLGIRSASELASSAFLASAAGASDLVLRLLPRRLSASVDTAVTTTLQSWSQTNNLAAPPMGLASHSQKIWDSVGIERVKRALLDAVPDDYG